MPLSEHEQRQLEQIEQALYREDRRLARLVRSSDPRVHYRRRVAEALVGLALGAAHDRRWHRPRGDRPGGRRVCRPAAVRHLGAEQLAADGHRRTGRRAGNGPAGKRRSRRSRRSRRGGAARGTLRWSGLTSAGAGGKKGAAKGPGDSRPPGRIGHCRARFGSREPRYRSAADAIAPSAGPSTEAGSSLPASEPRVAPPRRCARRTVALSAPQALTRRPAQARTWRALRPWRCGRARPAPGRRGPARPRLWPLTARGDVARQGSLRRSP